MTRLLSNTSGPGFRAMLAIGLALMQGLSSGAWAQGTGEADPSQAQARPSPPTTQAERLDARNQRKAEGRQAARGAQLAEGNPRPSQQTKLSKSARRAESARRNDANRRANRRGEFARGGNADAPELRRK